MTSCIFFDQKWCFFTKLTWSELESSLKHVISANSPLVVSLNHLLFSRTKSACRSSSFWYSLGKDQIHEKGITIFLSCFAIGLYMSWINYFSSTCTTWLTTVLASSFIVAFIIRFSGWQFEVNLVSILMPVKKASSFSVFALFSENNMYWSVACQ